MADEIIKELWKIKDDIAKEYDGDLKALAAYLRSKSRERGHQIIDRSTHQKTEQKIGIDQR